MKIITVFLLALYSLNIFAGLNMKIDFEINGKKASVSHAVKLDQNYVKRLARSWIEYRVSGERPLDLPSTQLWDEDSIYLKVKIYNSKGILVSSPEVMTVLGRTAIIEKFNSKNKATPFLKLGFLATRP